MAALVRFLTSQGSFSIQKDFELGVVQMTKKRFRDIRELIKAVWRTLVVL